MNASFCVLNRNSAQELSHQARWHELLARLLQSDIVFILTPVLPKNYDMLWMMSHRILVVDDEPAVTDLLAYNLRKAHYEVLVANDGHEALRLANEGSPDLILLDLMIPEVDGLDVCRELRKTSGVPIIMITARGEEIDRVVGLELGADDYVTKPFSVRELMARIKAVLRRAQSDDKESAPSTILYGPGGLQMDVDAHTVVVEDKISQSDSPGIRPAVPSTVQCRACDDPRTFA